jgi:hypothetical protein
LSFPGQNGEDDKVYSMRTLPTDLIHAVSDPRGFDALDVWAQATPTEMDQLHGLMWAKRLRYIQNHTSAQRDEDPTWIKLKSAYADLHGR